ncbi:MAG: hypothetical protein K6A15_10605 [Treponema sp.]|nr:hypothetical protein [Treponema sp.]
MKKFILSLFFVIFALFNVCGEDLLHPVIRDDIDEDIKKIELALVDYAFYPEMVERGFDVHQLDNMKIDGEMFEYVESFFRPNEEKGWLPLDNHHYFGIKDENGKWLTGSSYHKRVLFSKEYGTKDELLKKGYVENETMFYYPSNGEKDWRVGKWSWSFINNKGKLIYRGPGKYNGTYMDNANFFDGYKEVYRNSTDFFSILETKKSVVVDFNAVEDYINDVKLPKKDYLIIDLSTGNGGHGGASSKFVETIKKSKYKKIIIITNDTTSASEDIVGLLLNDKRIIRIGRNTNGRHFIGGVKCALQIKEKNFSLLYGDAIVKEVEEQEGIGYLPDIWADNKEDVIKNVISITGDNELKLGTKTFVR